jgi:hypothetical protein
MKTPVLLILMGVLLVCAIGLLALVKVLVVNFDKHGKKPYFAAAIFALLNALTGLLIAYLCTDQPFEMYWILSGIFIVVGIVCTIFTHKRFFFVDQLSGKNNRPGEFAYVAAIMLMSALFFTAMEVFLLKYSEFLFYPILFSFLVFFIPLLFITSFNQALSIPPSYFPVLEYPEVSKESPDDNPNERLLVIGFELAKKSTETRSYFRARTPDDILLGDLFYFFINDYNESQSETTIQYRDAQNNSYKWWFRLKPKWYQGERVLDPSRSMKDNQVVENSIIICERLL